MNLFKNENHYCSNVGFGHQNYSNNPSVLKADLKQLKVKQLELEEKISNHDCLKSEKNDLLVQLERLEKSIKDAKENQNKFFDSVTRELANTSIMSEQLSAKQNAVIKFEDENQEFERFLRSQTLLETQMVDETKRLERVEEKSKAQNDELRVKLALDRKRVGLEDAVVSKSSEADKCRDELTAAETDMRAESKRLVELQRRNADCDRTSRRLADQRADREAELAAFDDEAAEQLARAARTAHEVDLELAAARATLSGLAADRRRAAEALCELQTASDAEAHRWRATIRDLKAESDRLTDRLSDASACILATVADNLRLADCARAHAERLADLTAEADRLERLTSHERSVYAARCAMYAGDAALLEDEMASKRIAIETVRLEIDDAMRRRSTCRPGLDLAPTCGST